MNEVVFITINQMEPANTLVGSDLLEIERENNGYKASIADVGAFAMSLLDLDSILQYIKTNLDVLDLQNYSSFTPTDGTILEYSIANNKFLPTPKTLAQVLDNSTPVVAWNSTLGHNAEITITQDTEVILDNFIPGTYQLTINQDSVGGHIFTMSSNTHTLKWANGLAPNISPAADASDTYTFLVPPSNTDIRGVPQFNFIAPV